MVIGTTGCGGPRGMENRGTKNFQNANCNSQRQQGLRTHAIAFPDRDCLYESAENEISVRFEQKKKR